ncbi:MAG: hypothetical protein GX607_00015 [Myxococcales bacterium]|nr:hypothetical protein [Myxococcales bacterium]
MHHARPRLPHRGQPQPPRGLSALVARAAALLLVTLGQTACDGWAWDDDAPRPAQDGSPFTIQVLGTKECPREGSTSDAPPPLGVELRITGWHPRGTPVNFYYTRLEDGEGRSYDAGEACEPLLQGPPLLPGQRAQGYVSFSVPAGARGSTLVYEPRLLDASGQSRKQRIEVPLGERD